MENKFCGDDNEDLFEFCMSYETVAHDFNLTENQNFKYINNLFRGDALRNFNHAVEYTFISYANTKSMILRHFNSADVQNRIKNELLKLNFSVFIEKEGSKTKALSAMASHISSNTQKCPNSYHINHFVLIS